MDKLIWMKTSNGEFSVKSAFKEVCREAVGLEVNVLMKKIWKSNLHQRLKMLLWRIAVGALLVGNKTLFLKLVGCGNK